MGVNIPQLMNKEEELVISLEPFTLSNGDTYQVWGTRSSPHMHQVANLNTGESREVPHKVVKKDGGVLEQAGGEPKVTDKDGNPWTEDMGAIGNGTVAECTNLITTFTGGDGKQYTRTSLVSVKVLELVEYIKENEAVGF